MLKRHELRYLNSKGGMRFMHVPGDTRELLVGDIHTVSMEVPDSTYAMRNRAIQSYREAQRIRNGLLCDPDVIERKDGDYVIIWHDPIHAH